MRPRVLLFCVVAAVLTCMVIWLRFRVPDAVVTHETKAATTNQSEQIQPTQVPGNRQASVGAPNVQSIRPLFLSGPAAPTPHSDEAKASDPRLLALLNVPIDFYGKVVDENSNAVVGATVKFHWASLNQSDTNSTWATQSDADGLFSLHGKQGASLTVWISKEGYYASQGGQRGVVYAMANNVYSPDPQNPVLFNLRKRSAGASLITLKRNYLVPRDGTPLRLDLMTGDTRTAGGADLIAQCWTEDEGKPSGARYNWRCRIVASGGLMITDEEFPFTAPENGYAPFFEIQMPADRPDWKNDVDLKFFYRLADGRYGRMTFSMIAGGQHFCMVDSFLNPAGSRNLEPVQTEKSPVPPAWAPPGTRAIIPVAK